MKSIGLVAFLALVSTAARAEDNVASIVLKDHKSTPAEIHVKARTPTTVTLANNDDQTEEFDSTSLKIEKIVA